MPVSGLPVAVEKTLSSLLEDNAVSSWKVVGEGDNTVVVLRLKPANPSLSTTMADPVVNRASQVQYYRRKPPSQVRRDIERATNRRQQGDQQSSECDLLPALFESQSGKNSSENEHTSRPTHLEERDCATSDVSTVCQIPTSPACSVDCNVSGGEQFDEHTEQIDSNVAGFDTGVVRSYVATLTEKAVQRRLKDNKRNVAFRKVVSCETDRRRLVMLETDDIVLEYKHSDDLNTPAECMYWFVKQSDKNMLPDERARISHLRTGQRVHSTEHEEIRARAERKLEALRGLLRFYLG